MRKRAYSYTVPAGRTWERSSAAPPMGSILPEIVRPHPQATEGRLVPHEARWIVKVHGYDVMGAALDVHVSDGEPHILTQYDLGCLSLRSMLGLRKPTPYASLAGPRVVSLTMTGESTPLISDGRTPVDETGCSKRLIEKRCLSVPVSSSSPRARGARRTCLDFNGDPDRIFCLLADGDDMRMNENALSIERNFDTSLEDQSIELQAEDFVSSIAIGMFVFSNLYHRPFDRVRARTRPCPFQA